MNAEKGQSVGRLSTDEIRRMYDRDHYANTGHVGVKVLDTVAALCDEVDALSELLTKVFDAETWDEIKALQ